VFGKLLPDIASSRLTAKITKKLVCKNYAPKTHDLHMTKNSTGNFNVGLVD